MQIDLRVAPLAQHQEPFSQFLVCPLLTINGKSNAVFVAKLDEVAKVLEAFKAATESGELDGAVVAAMSKASKA